jgi:predicted transcriptional regulator of viral defense system
VRGDNPHVAAGECAQWPGRQLDGVAVLGVKDWLLAHGRTSVTTAEVAKLLDIPMDHVRVRLHQPAREGLLFSPGRGLWVPVPPQYRSWGVVPGVQFVHDLLSQLGRDYYVGWPSAAELYGAAHQRPQVTQVAVDRQVADRQQGRVRLRFYERTGLSTLPRVQRTVESGQVWVSSPELTAADLADRPGRGGGVSNVATILAELSEEPGLSGPLLADVAGAFPAAASRRLGYLLERAGSSVDLELLRALVHRRPLARPAVLTPQGPPRGTVDSDWQLLVNAEVEADL